MHDLAVADEQLARLRTALATNSRIGIAIGILMAVRTDVERRSLPAILSGRGRLVPSTLDPRSGRKFRKMSRDR